MPILEARRVGVRVLLQALPSRHEDRHGIWVQFIQTKGGIIMIGFIIGVFIGAGFGFIACALLRSGGEDE